MARPKRSEPKYTLRKQSNGIYAVCWWDNDQQRTRPLSLGTKDKKLAEQKYDQFLAGLRSPVQPSRVTLNEILDLYDKETEHLRSKGIKPACGNLKRHLGNLKPEHLTSPVIRKYSADRKLDKLCKSNGTILKEIGVLRAALNVAAAHRWISYVPIIKSPVSTPPARDRHMTREEFLRLFDACEWLHLKLYVLMYLQTGKRNEAILSLTWSKSINFENRLIHFGTGHGNKKRADAPMDDELYEMLLIAKDFAVCDQVIEWKGDPVKSVKTAFKTACRKAGLKGVTAHTMKATCCTWMVQRGIPFQKISQLTNTSVAIIEKHYAKYHPDYLKEEVMSLRIGITDKSLSEMRKKESF